MDDTPTSAEAPAPEIPPAVSDLLGMWRENARLTAEVERLRAALEDIATVRGLAADLQARARAALNLSQEPRT
jgi:hypothetical protein